MTFKFALLFALNAVGLAFVFFGHNDPPIATHSKLRERPVTGVRTRKPYPESTPKRGISGVIALFVKDLLWYRRNPRLKALQKGFRPILFGVAVEELLEKSSMPWDPEVDQFMKNYAGDHVLWRSI